MTIFQVGCNNCQDEVKNFVFENKEKIDKLIVIDALPEAIKAAQTVYQEFSSKLISLTTAVGTKNGIISFFCPSSDPLHGHASANIGHVMSHLHKEISQFYSPVLDINDIFSSLSLVKIDRLYLDMEGWDVETILHIDFKKIDIPYIEFEYSHSDGPFSCGENFNKVISKLQSLRYSISRSGEYNLKAEK